MITTYDPTTIQNSKRGRKCFDIKLPPETCGILSQPVKPSEIRTITVKCRKRTTSKDGSLTAVMLDNEPTARLVKYNELDNGLIVLSDPQKYEYSNPCRYNPDKKGNDPIKLTAAEAATRLKVLGVVYKIAVYMK